MHKGGGHWGDFQKNRRKFNRLVKIVVRMVLFEALHAEMMNVYSLMRSVRSFACKYYVPIKPTTF